MDACFGSDRNRPIRQPRRALMAIGNFQPSPLDGRQETTGPVRTVPAFARSVCVAGQFQIQNPGWRVRGSAIYTWISYCARYVSDVTGVVQTGQSTWIIIKLESHQVQNLPKASLLTVDLGGSDHWLFLSDTAAMFRDLAICAKYESTPPCPVLVSSCCKICSSQDRSRVLTAAASASTQSSAP